MAEHDEAVTPDDDLSTLEAVVEANASEVKAIIEPDLPDEAYAELFNVDPATNKADALRYDRSRGRWTPT